MKDDRFYEKEKLDNILRQIDESNRLKNEYLKITRRDLLFKRFVAGFILIPLTIGVIYCGWKKSKADKAIVYNDDKAIIFDLTSDDFFITCDDDKIIYVDEDAGISANDIATTLVGEEGEVYYYNSATKEKELVYKQ